MHNLLKRRYANKKGSSCALCKPHKHHHEDRRTQQDKLADIKTQQELAELQELEYTKGAGRTPPG